MSLFFVLKSDYAAHTQENNESGYWLLTRAVIDLKTLKRIVRL
jgi:hypothetical protein